MILSDNPITKSDDDELRRGPLAKKVADLIMKFKGNESYVIGIEGDWGSGKTSFINMVMEDLEDDVIYFPFNPWFFSDEKSLLINFFSEFAKNVHKWGMNKETGKKVLNYGRQMLGGLDVNILGVVSLKPLQRIKQEPMSTLRGDLDLALLGLSKKMVIVIDDIDRLDPEETKAVFKLVKLSANFPNTVFILAYDREKVEARLTIDDDKFKGSDYLKKIVQVSFSLPEPDRQDLHTLFFADLNATIEEVYGKVDIDDKRWGTLFWSGLNQLFGNIRDIKRFISSLRLNWSIVGKDDVNPVDFIGIEAIRVFAPALYSSIPSNRELFIGQKSLYMGRNTRDEEESKRQQYQGLLTSVDESIRGHIDKMCETLFPRLKSESYGHSWEENWRKELAICSREKFDFYFQLGVPTGSVSESELKALMETVKSTSDFKSNLLRFYKEGRLKNVLLRLSDFTNRLSTEEVTNFISAIWSLHNDVELKREGMFDINDFSTVAARLTFQSIQKSIDVANRGEFVKSLVSEFEGPLFMPAQFVSLMDREDKGKNEEEMLVSDEVLEECKGIMSGKIKSVTGEKKLKEEKNALYVLFRWKEWSKNEDFEVYIDDLIVTNIGLATFLSFFISRVYSTAGDYDNINHKSVEALTDLSAMQERVRDMSDTDLHDLSQVQKQAIELFKNPPKDW